MYEITLILGDGIGPEISASAKACLEALNVKINWHEFEAGMTAYEQFGDPLPQEIIDSVRETKVALKAPITTPLGTGFRSANVKLRLELGLFACVRPFKTLSGIKKLYGDVDLVIVRENTEDLYCGIEYNLETIDSKHMIDFIETSCGCHPPHDSAFSIKSISRTASNKICKFAFEYARAHNRSMVTSVTKSNIMKYSDGLFKDCADKLSKEYPDIIYEHRLVDALAMHLVMNPSQFDILVLPNLYGDIMSDLCAGLTGGLGIAPGANIGEKYAVFESVHGSAPDIAGKGIANPTALLLSAAMMLEHIGEKKASEKLSKAVENVISEGENVTCDLNPTNFVSTKRMTEAIIEKLI